MARATLEGTTLGKYQVLEPLGQGGMARVYRAYHPLLNRFVAIKVMRSDLTEEAEFLARFRREAQLIAALRHTHIIHVFDFDVQGELYFMVMELLEGDSLSVRLNQTRLRNEKLEPGEIVRVLLDVLDGLAYAHGEGMIHRDLKPSNILLTRLGQAVITDFGIAQMVGGTRYTMSGALMGTLQYMAPEQGMRGQCDARSDLYSLGIMLFEMLTGQPPFDAETPLAILMKHLNDPLPSVRSINPAIPDSIERVTFKALNKNPEDRYSSAAEMMTALQTAVEEAGLVVPASISLPPVRDTQSLPLPTANVFSGTAKQNIAGANFAAEETRADAGATPAEAGSDFGTAAAALGIQIANLAVVVGGRQAKKITERISKAALDFEKRYTAASTGPEGEQMDLAADRPAKESAGTVPPDTGPTFSEFRRERRKEAKRKREIQYSQRDRPQKDATPPSASHQDTALSGVSFAFLLVGGNAAALYFCGVSGNWTLFTQGWPLEFLLVALGMSFIMEATANIWMLIPVGLLGGVGSLLSYFYISGHWEKWYLWPLLALLFFMSLWFCVAVSTRGKKYAGWWARALALLITLVMATGLVTGVVTLIPFF
jgi:tRNA A-37 threonylcarbamoyl transferase component Bud32